MRQNNQRVISSCMGEFQLWDLGIRRQRPWTELQFISQTITEWENYMAVLQVSHRIYTHWWGFPKEILKSSEQYALTRTNLWKLCKDQWSKLPPTGILGNEHIIFTVLKVRQERTTYTKRCSYLLFELTGFIDETISFLLQLVNNLPLFLSFILIIFYFFFQVLLWLFMELHQIYLLLSGIGSLDQVLQGTQNND